MIASIDMARAGGRHSHRRHAEAEWVGIAAGGVGVAVAAAARLMGLLFCLDWVRGRACSSSGGLEVVHGEQSKQDDVESDRWLSSVCFMIP